MKTVILCGGSGTRLWPISRTRTPKQFAKIFNGQSLYEKTIQRNQSLSESFCVVVNDKQLPSCHGQTSGDINVNFLIEPVGRNTAAAIALAALASNPDEILLVLPSDHLIKDLEKYEQAIEQAKAFAKDNKLVTFGIEAKYPETGYGYIEAQGSEVLSFKEKPDLETAKEYLKKGNYYWNSGMFCFKASTFLEELFCHSPDIFNAAKKTHENKNDKDNISRFKLQLMEQIPSDSIDYAVMEKSQNVCVVPSNFDWSDLGSFDSLYDELEKDENGNTNSDEHISLNSNNNLVLANKKIIATFDIDDLIIVDTDDALLIGKKGQSQKVKQLLEKVKQKNLNLLD